MVTGITRRMLGLWWLCTGVCFAQAPLASSTGQWLLNPGAERSLVVSSGELLGAGQFRVNLATHALYAPGSAAPAWQLREHVTVAWAPHGRIQLQAQVPVVLLQRPAPAPDLGVGRPWAGLKVGLLSPDWDDAVWLALEGAVGIPGLEQAPDGEYLTDRLSQEAASFIRANSGKPFLLVLAHYAPHTPLRAPEATVKKYTAGRPGSQGNPIYAAMLEHVDNGVGLIMKTLRETGRDTDTVVAFTSDNGGLCTREGPNTPATSNAPLREGKGYLYEGGIRVPLLVSAPGMTPRVVDTPANGIDLLPTLTELAGIKVPASLDGISMVGALKGEATPARTLGWHYPHYANQGGKPGGAWRDGRWKLVEFYENQRRELFDLQADPSESRNLALDQPDRVASMAKALEAWRKETGAMMPTPNTAYKPNPPGKDGVIRISSSTANVEGAQLRFEPQPHKNTLGFWIRQADIAKFEATVEKEGTYVLRIVQGCGNGSGGARVAFEVAGTPLEWKVEETGGFQNWVTRDVGKIALKPGRVAIVVRPLSKPGVAVMDLQEMILAPSNP